MLVRKCDICGKETRNFWELIARHITFDGKSCAKEKELEICEECMESMKLPDIEYGYVQADC